MEVLVLLGLFVGAVIAYCLVAIISLAWIGYSSKFLEWWELDAGVPKAQRRRHGNDEGMLGVALIVAAFWPVMLPLSILAVLVCTVAVAYKPLGRWIGRMHV